MAEQLYHLIKPYQCKICHKESLYFMTKQGILIEYRPFIKDALSLQRLIEKLTYQGIRFLRCTNCNISYVIDWSHGWPEQLVDLKVLQEFGFFHG